MSSCKQNADVTIELVGIQTLLLQHVHVLHALFDITRLACDLAAGRSQSCHGRYV
jgi:hypothetical protein